MVQLLPCLKTEEDMIKASTDNGEGQNQVMSGMGKDLKEEEEDMEVQVQCIKDPGLTICNKVSHIRWVDQIKDQECLDQCQEIT